MMSMCKHILPTCAGFAGLLAACGCISTAQIVGGPTGPLELREPTPAPLCRRYETSAANRTVSIPVAFDGPDVTMRSTLTRHTAGLPVVIGQFDSGTVLDREFRKVFAANFRRPEGDEKPVAVLSVMPNMVSVKANLFSSEVSCDIWVEVKLVRANGADSGYSRKFRVSRTTGWDNRTEIPPAFYAAIEGVVADFLKDWDGSGATASLLEWYDGTKSHVKGPELVSLEFAKEDGGVMHGNCSVACNGYEGFQARGWAIAQISAACKARLGIEAERVRVVYEEETYDPARKTWKFFFVTFARTAKVFSYNPATLSGSVSGDLGLMGVGAEAAAEELRAFALKEMDARSGTVNRGKNISGRATVRFGDIKHDKTYDLITLGFRLVY